LSSHLNKKFPCENLLVTSGSNEIYRINFGLEDDLERARVVFFYFDEMELGECFFNILLNGLEIAFDKIEGDMFNVIRHVLNFIDELILLRKDKWLFLLSTLHSQQIWYKLY